MNYFVLKKKKKSRQPRNLYPLKLFSKCEGNIKTFSDKLKLKGTSLVIQWLRYHIPNAGAWVQSVVRELDTTCCN